MSATFSPAPYKCRFCGADSWIDPSDQTPPPDYCHEIDHGTDEDRAQWAAEAAERPA